MNPVIVFDGVCNLCNSTVDFLIRRDRKGILRFASNQSEAGRALLREHGIDPEDVRTVYLIEDGKIYKRSAAALKVARHLGGAWKLSAVFWAVPGPLRDVAYNLVARNRYRLFGKRETCRLPKPEERARFLDADEPARAG